MKSANLSNKAFILISIILIVLGARESLRVAVAIPQLISGEIASPLPDGLQDIDAVHQTDLQAKAIASNKTLDLSDHVVQASAGTWDFNGGRLLAVGAGAVVGVVALNYISGGTLAATNTTPALTAIGAAGVRTVAASSSIVSIYGLIGAVIGGIAGNYVYNEMQVTETQNLVVESSPTK